MRYFVTGAAGFIGSILVDRLIEQGHEVVGFDNFSTGQERFLHKAMTKATFSLCRGDLLDADMLTRSLRGCEFVFHLAANADVRFGLQHPRLDLEQNTLGTFHLLEAMRSTGVSRLAFASTGSIYGEAKQIPTPEDAPFPLQTSLYGASKLAAESLITAYCEGFGFRAHIFRFVSILGERYTHGHVFDFFKQLQANPRRLRVLGNGRQRKAYLYVHDCINAMLLAIDRATKPVNVFNLGTQEYCQVTDSIGWICSHLGLNPEIEFTGGDRGWIGDNPFIFLDTSRIQELGWRPQLSIREGVIRTVEFLQQNPWVLSRR